MNVHQFAESDLLALQLDALSLHAKAVQLAIMAPQTIMVPYILKNYGAIV